MTTITLSHAYSARSARRTLMAAVKWVGSVLFAVWQKLEIWQERANQRHRLLELDERLLKDIGVSRAEAEREAQKPFWRP